MIIGPPPESRCGRFKGALAKIHPIVWAAVTAGVFGLLGLWLGSFLQSAKLQAQVDTLTGQLSQQDKMIQEKTAEVQRLETLLTPFRTIALEKFTGDEKEALRKLADYVIELREKDVQQSQLIDELTTAVGKAHEQGEQGSHPNI